MLKWFYTYFLYSVPHLFPFHPNNIIIIIIIITYLFPIVVVVVRWQNLPYKEIILFHPTVAGTQNQAFNAFTAVYRCKIISYKFTWVWMAVKFKHLFYTLTIFVGTHVCQFYATLSPNSFQMYFFHISPSSSPLLRPGFIGLV